MSITPIMVDTGAAILPVVIIIGTDNLFILEAQVQ
jgi:hypothetical protein